MTPTPPTLPQTICLLALSRGEQPPYMPPATRKELLRKRWIWTLNVDGKRIHAITDAGRSALATSKHLSEAQLKLDAGKQRK